MEVVVIIACTIIVVLLFILLMFIDEPPEKTICGIFIFIFGGLISGFIFSTHEEGPRAIDVYRGNTTLQVTYQDSIAVDSIVVFKK